MNWIPTVLGRAESPHNDVEMLAQLRDGGTVLVTGGLGSIGLAVCDLLEEYDIDVIPVDLDEMNVTQPREVSRVMAILEPTTILHLAGAKHAPEGEVDPMEPARVHIDGTRNVLDYAPVGARVVTASTCKACDPETAYGASKLIAERLTLNAGQSVARFHNVVDTVGNVFETWKAGGELVMPCSRYFISTREAVSLLLYAATVERPGRFSVERYPSRSMLDVRRALMPDAEYVVTEPRRGDRLHEPYCALSERVEPEVPGITRITSPHDRVWHA